MNQRKRNGLLLKLIGHFDNIAFCYHEIILYDDFRQLIKNI